MISKRKGIVIMCAAAVFVIALSKWMKNDSMVSRTEDKKLIAIDPGHGGFDPGKVGLCQSIEKNINLSIALELKKQLEKNGYQVVMTRELDEALHEEGSSHITKRMDMKKRVDFINQSDAEIAVSIHQNSFTESSPRGAQVFYHTRSEAGKELALVLQAKIKEILADGNYREAKTNEDYYMLKKTTCPFVIVECGFLSNQEEAALLVTEEYQKKVATAISQGIYEYFKREELKNIS
ncbi:MAG: N-acetylmuramoyl-L-alanine amidase [Acetivibrio sp.]